MDIFLYRSYFKTPDLSIVGHSETIVFITPSPIPRCRPGPLGPGHHTPLVSDQLEDVAALSSQLSGPNLHVGSHFCMHTIVHFFLWHFLSFPSCQDSPYREKANYPLQRCIPNLLCGAKELVCGGSPIAFSTKIVLPLQILISFDIHLYIHVFPSWLNKTKKIQKELNIATIN